MGLLTLPPDPLEGLPVVLDFDNLPLDGIKPRSGSDGWTDGEWDDEEEPDEDNSVLADRPGHYLPAPDARARAAYGLTARKPQARIVGPLRRELRARKTPFVGKDVQGYRRAMDRLMVRKGKQKWRRGVVYSNVAGPLFYAKLRRAQKLLGLPADGILGNATHRALAPYMDAYAIKLIQTAKLSASGPELARQKLRAQGLYLINERERVGYTMGPSRMSIVRRWLVIGALFRYGDLWEDCSSSVKGIFKLAGLPDPNGFGYGTPARPNTYGFTGTMLRTGHEISPRRDNLKIGDAFFAGAYPYTHMWYYIGGGYAFSHGKPSDPRLVPYNYRPIARAQRYIEPD